MRFYNTTYHRAVNTTDLQTLVNVTSRKIKAFCKKNVISHLVVSGISGQSIGWPVSYKINLPICVVRKKNEESHGALLEGRGELEDYIILDDLIDSGATLRRIVETIHSYQKEHKGERLGKIIPKCRGIFIFNQKDTSEWRDNETFDCLDGDVPLYFVDIL